MKNETVKKIEEVLEMAVSEHLEITNNAIWNQQMAAMVKNLSGALRDIQEYNSKKFGNKK